MTANDSLSLIFSALGDPTRRAILHKLTQGDRSVSELSEPFNMSLPAVTKHLKVLERAGLISRSKEAQWRPCKLEPKAIKQANDWISTYRAFWEESLDRLEDYLATYQKQQKHSKGAPHGKNKKRK